VARDLVIAFRSSSVNDRGLEVRANFGIYTGREVTPAELDELGQVLLAEIGEVSVVAEQRHEVGAHVGAALHLVRIEVDEEQVPSDPGERERLAERVVELVEDWMLLCSADRHAEVTE
jgi:hypothetical protein